MSASLLALLAFVAWTLLLVLVAVTYRVSLVLTGKAPANSWTRGAATWQNPALITRVEHAHMNCVENLPLFAAVVLVAAVTSQTALTDGLVWVFIGLRIAQSVVHIISTSAAFVFIRANLLVGQFVILIYWLLALAGLL